MASRDITRAWRLRAAQDEAGLLDLLADDVAEPDDRLMAARFLGELRVRAAVPELRKALNDSDDGVRIAAIRSLGWLQSREVSDDLLTIASDAREPREIRDWALESLVLMADGRAVTMLIGILEDPSRYRRRWAARHLTALGDSRALEPLRRARKRDVQRWWIYTRAIRSCQAD